jgi:hypothetical protein
MRLNLLYLAGAFAVAVVPLSAAAQSTASLPTATAGNTCPAGWRWVPSGYSRESQWSLAHCEKIPVSAGLQATMSLSEGPSAGTACPTGARWIPGGYSRESEWVSGHCGSIPGSTDMPTVNFTSRTASDTTQCPLGSHWVAGGYSRETEWVSAHCAQD